MGRYSTTSSSSLKRSAVFDDVGLREAASTRTSVGDRKSCAGSIVAACQYRSNCDPLCPALVMTPATGV